MLQCLREADELPWAVARSCAVDAALGRALQTRIAHRPNVEAMSPEFDASYDVAGNIRQAFVF